MEPLDYQKANRLAQGASGILTLGGETYEIPQPTKPDFIALQKYLLKLHEESRSALIARVSSETKDLPRDVREMAVKAAVDRLAAPSPEQLSNVMLQEPKAMAFWVWLLAKKKRPELKLTDIVITDETLDHVAADLLTATSMGDLDPNSPGATGSPSS